MFSIFSFLQNEENKGKRIEFPVTKNVKTAVLFELIKTSYIDVIFVLHFYST